MNCLSCDESKGFIFFEESKNCLNCKSLNKFVNYEKTECIDSIPEGYYINDTEINTIDKCHKNCLSCNGSLSNDGNMNCLTCADGFYLVENTNNCEKKPYMGYYLDKNKFKKCYKDCLTCSEAPISNGKGVIINMNCDSCDESKGFYLVTNTKNCEEKNKILDADNCPVDKPISKNGKCVLEYCTKKNMIIKNVKYQILSLKPKK